MCTDGVRIDARRRVRGKGSWQTEDARSETEREGHDSWIHLDVLVGLPELFIRYLQRIRKLFGLHTG